MSFLMTLLGLADPISKITGQIANVKIERSRADTDDKRIAADERIKALERRRDVLIAEAGQSNINAIMRAAIAMPVAIVLWKIFVWDKALGQWTSGRTDALSSELWQVITAVIGFYFLYEGAIGVTRIMKR